MVGRAIALRTAGATWLGPGPIRMRSGRTNEGKAGMAPSLRENVRRITRDRGRVPLAGGRRDGRQREKMTRTRLEPRGGPGDDTRWSRVARAANKKKHWTKPAGALSRAGTNPGAATAARGAPSESCRRSARARGDQSRCLSRPRGGSCSRWRAQSWFGAALTRHGDNASTKEMTRHAIFPNADLPQARQPRPILFGELCEIGGAWGEACCTR
jgi:hypothetical protein